MLNTLLPVAEQALVYQGGYGGDYSGPRPQFQRYNICKKIRKTCVFMKLLILELGCTISCLMFWFHCRKELMEGFIITMIQTLLLPKLDGGNKINV